MKEQKGNHYSAQEITSLRLYFRESQFEYLFLREFGKGDYFVF